MIYSLIKDIATFPIRLYKWLLSPILSNVFGMRCRYDPSCSQYMMDAIYEWGVLKGIWLGLKRIVRCNPWGGFGIDPVPKRPTKDK